MKRLVCAFVGSVSLAGASLLACSSSSGGTASVAEAGADVVVATDAPKDAVSDVASDTNADSGGTCNAVVNAAMEATTSTVKGAAPAATGGTIAAGTYFQKELNIYDPMGNASAPMPSGLTVTLVIAGSIMQSVQMLPDGSSQTFTETFSVAGTTLKRDLTCPKPGPDLAAVYSVTGSTLVIYETDPMTKLVAGSVYAKQ